MTKNTMGSDDDTKIASWLEKVFWFLSKHRGYNHELQRKYYTSVALGSEGAERKLLSLVWKVSQTQSGDGIDRLGWTLLHLESITSQCKKDEKIDLKAWLCAIGKEMQSHSEADAFSRRGRGYFKSNFEAKFDSKFDSKKFEESYKNSPWKAMTDLFEALPGFGFKTGRLLAKAIYHCGSHKLGYLEEDQLYLTNVPELQDTDLIQLPVDRVIINMFTRAYEQNGIQSNAGNAEKIARTIERCCSGIMDSDGKGLYAGTNSEVWDDLWFWGFISQKGSGDIREHGFNLNKYLCLEFAQRDDETINKLRDLSNQFIGLHE